MVNVTCDRCGKPTPWMFNVKCRPEAYPIYCITCMPSSDGPFTPINLCDDCKKDFVSWLKDYSREEQSVE